MDGDSVSVESRGAPGVVRDGGDHTLAAAEGSTRSGLDFETISDSKGLETVASEWRELSSRIPDHQYFQTYEWLSRAWTLIACRRGYGLHILAARSDGRLALIWPLVVHRRGAWRCAKWLGVESQEYCDVLMEAHPEARRRLEVAWEIVTNEIGIDVLQLQRVREDALIAPLLRNAVGAWTDFGEAQFVNWSDWPDWDAYYKGIPAKLRSDQRRQRRRLSEKGFLRFDLAQSGTELERALAWVARHKADWLQARQYSGGPFQSDEMRVFFEAAARDAFEAGNLRVSCLTLDDAILAAQVSFVFKGRQYGYVTTYDPEWSTFSPGRLLIEETLKRSCDQGLGCFDMLTGDDPYKRHWTNRKIAVGEYLVPCTRRGAAYVAWFGSAARERLKRAYHTLGAAGFGPAERAARR